MPQWNGIVEEWLGRRRFNSTLHADLLVLFESALANTMVPEESWFGYPPKRHSIGVFFGNVMLAGMYDRTVEVIVDEDISSLIGFRTRPVNSSVARGPMLHWITSDIKDIGAISRIPIVWEHYKRATILASGNSSIRGQRKAYTQGKVQLSKLLVGGAPYVDSALMEESVKSAVQKSLRDSKTARLKRMALAPAKPVSIIIRTRSFLRNPDVIAEVLLRAKGHCEHCGQPAPFVKDSDGTPYLEVHHVIALADNGDDTVSNALALCPNCHRHAHHGRGSFRE